MKQKQHLTLDRHTEIVESFITKIGQLMILIKLSELCLASYWTIKVLTTIAYRYPSINVDIEDIATTSNTFLVIKTVHRMGWWGGSSSPIDKIIKIEQKREIPWTLWWNSTKPKLTSASITKWKIWIAQMNWTSPSFDRHFC